MSDVHSPDSTEESHIQAKDSMEPSSNPHLLGKGLLLLDKHPLSLEKC